MAEADRPILAILPVPPPSRLSDARLARHIVFSYTSAIDKEKRRYGYTVDRFKRTIRRIGRSRRESGTVRGPRGRRYSPDGLGHPLVGRRHRRGDLTWSGERRGSRHRDG